MRKQPAEDGANKTHRRSTNPTIALGVVSAEQLRIAEQVAVDTREDDAREGVVLEGAAGDGLAARLERHQRDGDQHVPGDGVLAGALWAEGDDGGGGDAEGRLQGEGGYEGCALLGPEVPVEAAEEEGPYAEEAEGGAGFDPAGALGWCG